MDADPLLKAAFGVLPWITYTVFTIGLIYKLLEWQVFKGITIRGLHGISLKGLVSSALLNYVIQRKLAIDRTLWVLSWLMFHATLFLILVGHLRGFGLWSLEWFTWLAPRDVLKFVLPTLAGLILMAALILLLVRRLLVTDLRLASSFSDHAVLILLMLVVVSGNVMRLSPHTAEELEIVIPPGLLLRLDATPNLNWLAAHAISVQILIMYLPFSKLVHVVTAPFIQVLREIDVGKIKAGVVEGGPRMSAFTPRQRVELDSCVVCGQCASRCPVYLATRSREVIPSRRLMEAKFITGSRVPSEGQMVDQFFKCCLCGSCSEVCPLGIDVAEVVRAVRIKLIDISKGWGEEGDKSRGASQAAKLLTPKRM